MKRAWSEGLFYLATLGAFALYPLMYWGLGHSGLCELNPYYGLYCFGSPQVVSGIPGTDIAAWFCLIVWLCALRVIFLIRRDAASQRKS